MLWTADAPDGGGDRPPRPERLSTQGTTTLSAIAVSESGELVALRASATPGRTGARWTVRRSRPASRCPIASSGASSRRAAWTHDDAGFFYGRYPEPPADAAYDAPNRDMDLRYHRLGTDAADDAVVFATPEEPEWRFEPEVSDDGRLLISPSGAAPIPRPGSTSPTSRTASRARSSGPLLDAADARLRAHRRDRARRSTSSRTATRPSVA